MSIEPAAATRSHARLRPERTASRSDAPGPTPRSLAGLAFVALASGFVLAAGGSLDPGEIEARLGLAAGGGFGPFGQVFGGWEPSLWPAQVAPSALWAWAEGGVPTVASIRWPSAVAGILLGLILARRASTALGARAGVLVAVCLFSSVALIDRSAGAGLDLIAGLATVAALDRLIARGADLASGAWAALAFLSAGWPPVALIALTTVVLGRPESSLSWRLLLPPVVAAGAWSAWALSVAPAEAWGAALALPLTQKSAWMLPLSVLVLGLPWAPFAALSATRSAREGWSPEGRRLVMGWLQTSGACLLAGTIIPGLASAARVPAIAGLAVVAAAGCDRAWAGRLGPKARRAFFGIAASIVALWTALVLALGIHLAGAQPYYRGLAVVLIIAALATAALGGIALARRRPRLALAAVFAVAVGMKVGHAGYYVPEWNYRRSQAPWGRAIGQWIPPRHPVYTLHSWSTALAFAIGHPVRQIPDPRVLGFDAPDHPRLVLLLDSEFEHWPKEAPPLIRVASFLDERGRGRVLARTKGDFSWRHMAGVTRVE